VMARNRFGGVENHVRSSKNLADKLKSEAADDEDGEETADDQDFLLELQRMLANDAVKGVKAAGIAASSENHVANSSSSADQGRVSRKQQVAKAVAKRHVVAGVTEEEINMLLTGKMNSTNVESHPFIELADEWLTDLNTPNVQ
jgi:hypothetical protein